MFSQFKKLQEAIVQQNENRNLMSSYKIPSALSNTLKENLLKARENKEDNDINDLMKMFGIYHFLISLLFIYDFSSHQQFYV